MNISFQCDVCSQTLSANEAAAGRVVKCPYCHNTIKIPRVEERKTQEETSFDDSQWRDPTFDPDWEKMLEKFPNFKPNPFGVSFPLDKAIREANLSEEFDEETRDSDDKNSSTFDQYSVDDLIKGVE